MKEQENNKNQQQSRAISNNLKSTNENKGLSMMPPPLQFKSLKGQEEKGKKPIQKKSNPNGMPEKVQTKMENAFGQDFSNVNIHTNSNSAKDMGALAYAQGNDVHFASGQYNPESQKGQELLGHELTHVVQQREGRVKPTTQAKGVAVNDDKGLEKEADDMGRKVVQGKMIQKSSNTNLKEKTFDNPIQRYVKKGGLKAAINGYNRVSNDGKLAVKDHGKIGFAEDSMISKANSILTGLNSITKVKKLSKQITIRSPDNRKQKNKLTKFTLVNRSDGKELSLRDDCGTANQQIMGAAHHKKWEFNAEYTSGGKRKDTASTTYHGDDRKAGGNLSTTEELSSGIYIDIMKTEFKKTLNREDALKEWAKLDSKEKDKLSAKYGINQYAVPKMGQGITIGSERDMPGSKDKGYNFHFGFNLMASGGDYITLEDYAGSGVPYYLDMYGPASKNQAWAQDPGNVGATDVNTTSMVVEHPDN